MKKIMEILGETGCWKSEGVCGCAEKKDKSGSSTSMDKGIWDVVIKEDFKPVKTVENLSYSDILIEKDKWNGLINFEYKNVLNTIYTKTKDTLKITEYIDDKCYEFIANRKKESKDFNEAVCGAKYRHFKGGAYELLEVAKGTEDDVDYAVYRSVNQPDKVYCRPLEMFLSPAPYPTRYCKKWRFERIS